MPDSQRPQAEKRAEGLEQEADKNLLIQQAINAILRISLEPISLDEQLHRVLELILKLPWLALERKGCIYLADEKASVLVRRAQVGMPAETLSACGQVPFGTCLCGQAIARKEVVFASCLDARHTVSYPGMLPHGHYCVPISSGERPVGLLNLYVAHGHERAPVEERFLIAAADVLAGIIERQRIQDCLHEQLILRQKSDRRLAAEYAVSKTLAAGSSLSDCALAILRTTCESLDWDVGIFWKVDPVANVLRCIEVWQAPRPDAAAFEQVTRKCTFSPGIGLPGRIWAHQTVAWIPDVAEDASYLRGDIAAKEGLHGVVGFPVRNGVEFLGVIEFCSREVRHLDDELIQMMTSIGSQISQFIERRQAEEELRRQEVDRRIARQVQQGLLPKVVPSFAGLQIAGRSAPALDVGGDCFDFFSLGADRKGPLGVLVADASGHGMGAALLVAETRAYLRALALTCADVGTLLTLSNRRLAGDLETDHFVTLFLLSLDPRTRSLVHASAGHCPGFILDLRGRTRAILASTGVPLGIDPAHEFASGPPTTLEPGDLLLLFTDGIVEAASPEGKPFGLDRTLSIVRAHQQERPDRILDVLFNAVGGFPEHPLRDDATAVIIKAER